MLTSTGRDTTPFLSFGGKTVVFARYYPGEMFRTALYAIDVPSRKETLLFAGPARYGGQEIAKLIGPQLAPDGKSLFFWSEEGDTTGALLKLDLQAKRIVKITDAASYDIIRCGDLFGDLLVSKRKESILWNIYYVYWLYSPDGKDLGIAGPVQLDRQPLLDPACTWMKQRKEQEETEAGQTASRARAVGLAGTNSHNVDEAAMAQRLRLRVEPKYPPEARAHGVEGEVRLEVFIDAHGNVTNVNLVSGPPELVASAVAAVREWKYTPMKADGKAVPVVTTVRISFSTRR